VTGPSPRDVARFDADCREMFGGCTEAFHRSRSVPYLQAHRGSVEQLEGGIFWRARWSRFKNWISSREAWLTFVALLIACAFMVGRAFAQERSIDVSIGERVNAVPAGVVPDRDSGAIRAGFDEWRPAAAGMGLPTRDAPAGESSVHVDSGRVAYVWSLRAGDSKFTRHSSKPARASSRRGASVVPAARPYGSHGRGGEASQRRTLAPDSVTYSARRESTAEPCPLLFGDSARPIVSPERFEECKAQALQEEGLLKVYAGLVVLLAVLSAIAAIHWMDRNMPEWLGEPKDEGSVVPPRGRW
jgi:hypothetical protein